MFAKSTILAGLVAFASAHQTMVYPPWFDGSSSSPLNADGSNFPCQNKFTGTPSTTWALGSPQTLKVKGSAVHGGGSAQFSITYDKNPTENSKWKVIHTIQGGMPARGLNDNFKPEDASYANPNTYPFTVPSTLPAGEAIFSWSWINRIGNREFYQFCSPITLTGTGGSQADYNALPDMVVLNIMGKASTTPYADIEFANPGSSVEDNLGKFGFPTELCCEAGCGASVCTKGASPPPSGGSGSGGSTPPSASQPAAPSVSIPGGVFITVPPSTGTQPTKAPVPSAPAASPSAPAAQVPSAPAPSVPAPSAPAAAPSAPAAAPSAPVAPVKPPTGGLVPPTGGAGALSGACTTEGEWNCIDGKSFQQCASGAWSVAMAMAQGTSCKTGQSSALSVDAAKVKRFARVFRA